MKLTETPSRADDKVLVQILVQVIRLM